ncbi:MAG TPA: nuclear transport factor 2 family protein [Acidimicrobiales bacterium]|nr:nuclear transport factor 2 family protein [Acidimicrobiales bacterium]
MTVDAKRLVAGIYRATETGDVAILDQTVSDDVIEHPLKPGQVRGRESLKMVFGGFSSIIADLRLTSDDMIASGD